MDVSSADAERFVSPKIIIIINKQNIPDLFRDLLFIRFLKREKDDADLH